MTNQNTPAPGAEEVKTARNSRHVVPTGTVADVVALFPTRTVSGVINGEELADIASLADRAVDAREQTARVYQRIADRDVEKARTVVRSTGIAEFLVGLVSDAKVENAKTNPKCKTGATKKGRPSRVTVEALLVAMWLAANTGRPMLLTEFRDILFHCISPGMRRLLDVSDGVTRRTTIPKQFRRWNRSSAKALGYTFRKMTAVIDPSDEIVSRANVLWADMKYRGLTDDQTRQFQAHLDWVCNQLLHVTYLMLPESVRQHDDGSRCIDATPLRLPATGRTLDDEEASSMPHGAYYVREGDHTDFDAHPGFSTRGGKHRRNSSKRFWALDLHLLALADATPGDRQHVPGLITAMTADRAAFAPADNARRLMASGSAARSGDRLGHAA